MCIYMYMYIYIYIYIIQSLPRESVEISTKSVEMSTI